MALVKIGGMKVKKQIIMYISLLLTFVTILIIGLTAGGIAQDARSNRFVGLAAAIAVSLPLSPKIVKVLDYLDEKLD